jgi:hypothetical protein
MEGNAYHHSKNRKDYSYYRCHRKCVHQVDKGTLEQLVIDTIRETFSTPKKIAAIVDEVNAEVEKQLAKSAKSITPIKQKITAIELSNSNLIDAIEKVGMSDIIQARLKNNEKQMASLRKDLALAESMEVPKVGAKEIRKLFSKWSKHNDTDSIQAMIGAFLSSVVVHKDHIDINLYMSNKSYTPSSLSHKIDRKKGRYNTIKSEQCQAYKGAWINMGVKGSASSPPLTPITKFT